MDTKSTESGETIQNKRLKKLVKKFGTQSEFGAQVGLDPTYVSRLLSPPSSKHHKRLGSPLARRIEQRAGRPPGWLDGVGRDEDVVEPTWPFRIGFNRFDNLLHKQKEFIEVILECVIAQFEEERQPATKSDSLERKTGRRVQKGNGRHRRAA